MKRLSVFVVVLLGATSALAQNAATDPVFWCDISRSQISHERDAGLAQIEALKLRNETEAGASKISKIALEAQIKETEALKLRNASLEARIKELEAKAAPRKDEPNE